MSDGILIDGYIPYQDLTLEDFNEIYCSILEDWQIFVDKNSPCLEKDKDYFIHSKNLYEVIRRTDKRNVYYKVFHKLKKINELKHTAILCYWINTLKPFLVVNEDSAIYNSPNELFVVHLIISAIRSAFEEIYPNKEFVYPSDERIADIVYNIKFCDYSRESMIGFVETFADNYGVGIEYILGELRKKEELLLNTENEQI